MSAACLLRRALAIGCIALLCTPPAVHALDAPAAPPAGAPAQGEDLNADGQWAEPGSTRAQYQMARTYLEGDATTPRDAGKAAYWFRQVAYSGDPEYAFPAMAALMELREEVLRDYPTVVAASVMDSDSLPPGMQLIGQGEQEEGTELLIRLAWLLDVKSQLALSLYYRYSIDGMPPYNPKILAFYEDSAAEGMPRSNLFLAKARYYGWGVEQDREAAIRHAGAAGYLHEALELLGDIHYEAGDVQQAVAYWEKAAQHGSAEGAYELGVLYRDSEQYRKAITWFERALELQQDFYRAMVNLGQIYIEGWGVEPDPQRGFAYYKRAADEDDGEDAAIAEYVVGHCYRTGTGVDQSKELAVEYLRRSAEHGFEMAQTALDAM